MFILERVTQNVSYDLQPHMHFKWRAFSCVWKIWLEVNELESESTTWKCYCNIHVIKENNIKTLHLGPVILKCLHEYSKLPPLIKMIIFMHIHTCSLLFQISGDYRLEFISHVFPVPKWNQRKLLITCCFCVCFYFYDAYKVLSYI